MCEFILEGPDFFVKDDELTRTWQSCMCFDKDGVTFFFPITAPFFLE